jgi:hypothetical protein
MNVELLESVRWVIVHYPDRFCAAQWAFARNAARVLREGAAAEGFRCCIAGHVLLEAGRHDERSLLRRGGFHTGGELWAEAADAVGLDDARCRELFFPSQWDKPYKQNYYLCSADEEATVAAAYLDYFMQKVGDPASETVAPAQAASSAIPAADRLPGAPRTVARGERAPVA